MANWAVVVGIDKYWTPNACLGGAVKDALDMSAWLLSPGGGAVPPANLLLLLSPRDDLPPPGAAFMDASMGTINKAILQTLIQRSNGQGERFFFHFAGHGVSCRRDMRNVDGLVASDFDTLQTDRSIEYESILDFFKTTQFQEQYFFFDSCRNIPWEDEFQMGRLTRPRKADPGAPPVHQFVCYATAPLQKAADSFEGGAFTQELLRGLGGQGPAKSWDRDAGTYVVRWEGLFKYVEAAIEEKRLALTGTGVIQRPRQSGERGSLNPELARLDAATIAREPLEVTVEPAGTGAVQVLLNDGDTVEQHPVPLSPTRIDLPPRAYRLTGAGPGLRSDPERQTVDLWGPRAVALKFVATPPPPVAVPGPRTRGLESAPATRALPGTPALATLTARSSDPVAVVEIADSSGRVLGQGRASVTRDKLPPGFYVARIRTPEGDVSETTVDLAPGDEETVDVSAPQGSSSAVVAAVLAGGGFSARADNTLDLSEMDSNIASARLSTILTLAANVVNKEVPWGHRLHNLGLRSARAFFGTAPCGLQVLFGCEVGTPDEAQARVAQMKVRVWPVGALPPPPLPASTFPQVKGLAAAAQGTGPGPHWVSIEMPGARPAVMPAAMIPGRLALMVVHEDAAASCDIYQYLPTLAPQEDSDPKKLRLCEMAQRFLLCGQLDPAYAAAMDLRAAGWDDPILIGLAGYLMLKLGKMAELGPLANEMGARFPEIADGPLLQAEHRAALKDAAGARGAYLAALDRGLPLFADGLERLQDAVAVHALDHPLVPRLKDVVDHQLRGTLWSTRSGLPG